MQSDGDYTPSKNSIAPVVAVKQNHENSPTGDTGLSQIPAEPTIM